MNYKLLKNDIYLYSLFLFVFVLPSGIFLLRSYVLILFIIISFFTSNFKKSKLSLFEGSLLILFLLTIAGSFYTSTENLSIAFKSIEKSLSFLAFPVLAIISRDKMRSKKQINRLLVIFIISTVCFGINYISFKYLLEKDIIHRVYIGVYFTLSQVFIIHLIRSINLNRYLIMGLNFLVVILFGFVLLTTGKMPILLSLLIVTSYFSFLVYKNGFNLTNILVIGFLIILFITLISLTDSFSRLLIFIEKGDLTRVRNWNAALKVIKNNIFFGVGTGDVVSELNNFRNVNWFPAYKSYNCHNQYFEFLAKFGLMGFIPFILGLISLLRLAVINRVGILFMFLFIIMLVFTTESFLLRQDGIFVFCFFGCLFGSHYNKKLC